MNEMNPLDVNLDSVSIFSQYALSAARKYVNLVESQLSQAHADMRSTALGKYPDETDCDNFLIIIDRSFEEDYQPILRFTEVIYLYMVFETYVHRHIDEIETLQGSKSDIPKKLNGNNLIEGVQTYFKKMNWFLLSDEQWHDFRAIAEVRNCIVHYAGVARDCKYPARIYSLESRQWCGQSVGIQIDHLQGKDIGLPIIIHQRFLEFFLDLLEQFFNRIAQETHAKFWNKK